MLAVRTPIKESSKYACDTCCKSDVCSLKQQYQKDTDKIYGEIDKTTSDVAVTIYCKHFMKERTNIR